MSEYGAITVLFLPFHSEGHMKDGQPVNIPLHDSELVYLVKDMHQTKFGELVQCLKIPEKDLMHFLSNTSTFTREMGIDVLCRWRDNQKDFVEARSTLAQSLAHLEFQETNTGTFPRSQNRAAVKKASAKILQGNIELTKF